MGDLAVTDATIAEVPAVSNAQNTSPEFGAESTSIQFASSSLSGPLGGNSDDSSGSVGTTRSSSQPAMSGIEGSSTSKEVEVNPATSARAEESATSTKPSASSLLPSEAPQSSGQSQATASSRHNDDTTEPVEQTRTTTARIDHETTSGEADIVINLKTVGSNIISSSVEEGGDDLTTRQFTFYTGSTKDNVIPDQTRHNDLQDKTTQTTKTLDTLTQDSTKTNDDEMQTTTDNKQAPAELNSSVLPSSETDVNTISNDLGGTKEPLSTQLTGQTMTSTVEEIEATKTSQGPTNPAWTDTTIDPVIDLNGDLATPEPDTEQNNNLVHDLTHASSTSSSSSPCVCPSTTTSLGTTDGSTTTTMGTTTASGECLCPDIFGPAEVETATDLPATSGGRRRREWEEDDLFVDDFDQKILKKMPFLKFY